MGSYIADISSLGGLKDVEAIDLDNYAESKANTFRLPAKGKYTLRAPDAFPPAAFGRTNAGALSVSIDPTIVGPAHEGFQVRFTKVSAKTFKRDGLTVSQLGDYLKACGVSGKLSNEQEQADAAEQTAGKVYEAELDWRAYSKSGFSLEGMERFPKNADGSYQSWVEDPTAKDENGNPVRVRANLIIRRFIASE